MTDQDAPSRRRALRRAADLERHAEDVLGAPRVIRARYESKPDNLPLTLPCGAVLQPECKARSKAPKVILDGMEQAKRYSPGAIPLVVLRPKGSSALAVLDLEVFARIAGIEPSALPTRATVTKRSARQMELWADG